MRSLRQRTLIGAALWTLSTATVGALALVAIIDDAATRRFDRGLADRHLQVSIALATVGDANAGLEQFLTDPAYSRPYSGRYWQITAPDGTVFTSQSLFDTMLASGVAASGSPVVWLGDGPDGPVRGISQDTLLEDGSRWTVDVAETLDVLIAEKASVRRSVALAFALVGALGVAGAMVLTSIVLRPLGGLRRDIAARWESGARLEAGDYPEEVEPLVNEINDLMDRNKDIVDRGRRQAADMAHALKTPSAALRNELHRLAREKAATARALEALDRIDAQVGRSLARFRAENGVRTAQVKTDLGTSLNRMLRLFRTLQRESPIRLEAGAVPDAQVRMDQQDLEEVLGNLLENAFKWAESTVRVRAQQHDGEVEVLIEDDGPGIPDEDHRRVLVSGQRLDTAVPGTGLGLAIANDLIAAYGGSIELSQAEELGGLSVSVRLPGIKAPAADRSRERVH